MRAPNSSKRLAGVIEEVQDLEWTPLASIRERDEVLGDLYGCILDDFRYVTLEDAPIDLSPVLFVVIVGITESLPCLLVSDVHSYIILQIMKFEVID
ncbi:unnamed protein product [Haemonchus placei]|uniref:Uncharacterized protein n=1 Tax=Haemonchus placei TaxID=6290 RepID=A0A0N4WKX3_HAEPC|nr:unnamed protein product [Haemonchus placei]